MTDLTLLLSAVEAGEAGATDRLYQAAYAELRALAQRRLRQPGAPTLLNPTALLHEAFLRMVGGAPRHFAGSRHFMAYAARAMRSVVVDLVRERQSQRRGGGLADLTLDTHAAAGPGAQSAEQVLQVHQALHALARAEPRLATVVELRYFGGLEDTEIAQALGLTVRTVQRDWAKARLYLSEALR